MTTKTLAAAALAATILSATQAKADQYWLQTDTWHVWQSSTDDGQHQMCLLKHFLPTAQGYATFGFTQMDTWGAGHFHYSEAGLVWNTMGTLTVQIDGFEPWHGPTQTDTAHDILSLDMPGQPQDTANFMSQIRYGSVLRVSTRSGTRVFSLAGSDQAVRTLYACLDAVHVVPASPLPPAISSPPARQPQPVTPLPPTVPFHGV